MGRGARRLLAAAAAVVLGASRASAAVLRATARAARSGIDLDSYSFDRFVRAFGRSYAPGSEEYSNRAAVFQASLLQARAVNARNEKEGRSWRSGVNEFMDWTEAERRTLNGYKPHRGSRHGGGVAFLNSGAQGRQRTNSSWRWEAADSYQASSGGLGVFEGPALRNQGNCGSCWAISAVEAVEAQLQRTGQGSVRLSAQALVDCVPNPQHCGGSGGCDGATGELAYSFMRDYGIPLEDDLPYRAKTLDCPESPLSGPYPTPSRVRVSGWRQLPSNQAAPLQQALTDQGPVVVAVDGNQWFDYDHGVFDGCSRDATLGHAVLAKGYGQAEDGKKYWLIQNSWGSNWGEQGHIRLLRRDDDDSWCGTDHAPQEGVGCDGGPPQVTVCGTCGVLFDMIVPEGVHLEHGSGTDSAAAASPTSYGLPSYYPAAAPAAPAAQTQTQGAVAPGQVGVSSSGETAEQEMDAILNSLRSPTAPKV